MKSKSLLIPLLACAFASSSHAAILITPTGATSSTAANDFMPAENLFNGSGLSEAVTIENYTTVTHSTHDANGYNNVWVTAGNDLDYFAAGPAPVLIFTLGQIEELTDIVIWGYPINQKNEARAFTLSFSDDGGTTWSGDVSLERTQLDYINHASAIFSLGGTIAANTVRMTITDNHYDGASGGGDRVGLGEVRFLAIPEPSAALLGGLGMLALLRRRRMDVSFPSN